MESSQAKKLVIDYIEAYNRFDVAGMLAPLHDEVIFRNVTGGEVSLTIHGKAEFQVQAEQARQYFSQREQRVTNWQITDNHVEVLIDYSAVAAIDLPNGLKAGDTLQLQGKSVFLFSAGKISAIDDIS
ncbi:nuclear transport factor 2 family protein [Hymenobacter sediminicola]|uniref:Nuclear transport factor 2 family protein n=1 Tax=Hymenobacter sediminicola TaxID=2761579 RepID=A0A7G7W8G8_9BACT|nr:nuclear transport factor 2 family protein [Hymenobacter sediminicola]QNH62661.1 nuclear transport factor 2 family protein [Hymenobacter sediminicola]